MLTFLFSTCRMAIEQEYEVEKIVNFGYSDGILYYHVKWIGYDRPEDMTWEPYSNLENCQDIVDIYFRSLNIPKPPNHDPSYFPQKKIKKKLKINQTVQNQTHRRNPLKQELKQLEASVNEQLSSLKHQKFKTNPKPTFVIDPETNSTYPYVFIRVPKHDIQNRPFFNAPEPLDYGPHVSYSDLQIEKIVKKHNELFVIVSKGTSTEHIPFQTALLLFPDALKNYLKTHSQ